MERFYVTKKKYDWIVKYNDEEYHVTEGREAAIERAMIRAKAVIADGGNSEVLVANILGLWDKVTID